MRMRRISKIIGATTRREVREGRERTYRTPYIQLFKDILPEGKGFDDGDRLWNEQEYKDNILHITLIPYDLGLSEETAEAADASTG